MLICIFRDSNGTSIPYRSLLVNPPVLCYNEHMENKGYRMPDDVRRELIRMNEYDHFRQVEFDHTTGARLAQEGNMLYAQASRLTTQPT